MPVANLYKGVDLQLDWGDGADECKCLDSSRCDGWTPRVLLPQPGEARDVVQRSVCPKPCKAAPRSSEHKLMTMGQKHRPTAGQINPTLNENPSVWIGKKDPTKESSTAIRMYLPPTGHVWKTALRKPSTRKEWTATKGGKGKDS